jgi:hypothetical protein
MLLWKGGQRQAVAWQLLSTAIALIDAPLPPPSPRLVLGLHCRLSPFMQCVQC